MALSLIPVRLFRVQLLIGVWLHVCLFCQPILAQNKEAELPPLTTAKEVVDWVRDHPELSRRVEVKGTVTYCDPQWGFFNLEDETGAVIIRPRIWERVPLRGQAIVVTGWSDLVSGLPSVARCDWRIIPETIPLTTCTVKLDELTEESHLYRCVDVSGIVEHVVWYGTRQAIFILRNGDNRLVVVVRSVKKRIQPEEWIGMETLVHGMCLPNAAQVGDRKIRLYVQQMDDLIPQTTGIRTPLPLPLVSIQQFPDYAQQRIQITGKVESIRSNSWIQIRDNTSTIGLSLPKTVYAKQEDRIEVIGYPEKRDGKWTLQHPSFRVLALKKQAQNKPQQDIQPSDYLPLLCSAKEVHALSAEEAKRGYPVRMQGLMTFQFPKSGGVFHDGAEGIYVMGDWIYKDSFPSGQGIILEGYSVPGDFAPNVEVTHLTKTSVTELPAAVPVDGPGLVGGAYDCQWIQVQGLVQSVEYKENDRHWFVLNVQGKLVHVYPQYDLEAEWLDSIQGASVSIQGVCTTHFNQNRQWCRTDIYIPHPKLARILRLAPSDPFEEPSNTIGQIREFDPNRRLGDRIKITGQLTLRAEDGKNAIFCVEDASGGITAFGTNKQPGRLGDLVDVVGFLGEESGKFFLNSAMVRVRTSGQTLTPQFLTKERLEDPTIDNRLVIVEGYVLKHIRTGKETVLVIQPPAHTSLPVLSMLVLSNSSSSHIGQVPEGTHIRISGILADSPQWRGIGEKRIVVESLDQVEILSMASWWTESRMWNGLMLALGICLVLLGIMVYSQRQIRQQTEMIRETFEEQTRLQSRYQDLVENANDLIFTIDSEDRITTFNRTGEILTGHLREDVLGRSIQDFLQLDPDQKNPFACRDELPDTFQARWRCRDDEYIDMEISTRPLFAEGKQVGMEGIARDITARKEAEQQLRQAYQMLNFHLQNSPLAFIEWDEHFTVKRWSRRAQEIFGWTEDEVRGVELEHWKFIHEADAVQVGEVMHKLMYANEPSNICRNRNYHKDGRVIHCAWFNSAERDAKGKAISFFSLVQDVTAQHQAEESRLLLEEQVRQSQKMEAIGRLAGSIAHDFNNLLTVINGCSDLMLLTMPEENPDRELANEIRKAGEHASSLTRQLLTFSRRQIVAPVNMCLNRVIEEIQKMLHRLLGENIHLLLELDPYLGNIKADPGMMNQLIMNLAVNARDAMPTGGKLILRTKNLPSGGISLEVQDTGCGMDAETQRRIFEPFFTTKPAGVGTGLGLSTVFNIVQQTDGHIEVESQLGVGTCFRIDFPRTGSITYTDTEHQTHNWEANTGETVLLVEDEPLVRNLARRILESRGYKVIAAEHGPNAIELFEQHDKEIQLLLTDVMMPEMNGRELAEELRRRRPSLKVIFMSGYTTDEVLRHGIQAERVHFVQKPFTPDTLTGKIQFALGQDVV